MIYRAAIYAWFAIFGIVMATWAVHLPALQTATGISTSMLGTTLLILGAGAIAGMRLSGRLSDRFGPRWVAVYTVGAMALAIVPPLAAASWPWAAAGAFVLGLAIGSAEVAMNAAAVIAERLYERPLMASFHGVFSASNVAGSLLSAAAFALHASTLTTALVASGVCLAVGAAAAAGLRRCPADLDIAVPVTGTVAARDPTAPVSRGRVAVLCLLAFLFLLAEGSAMDWSSMHAQRELGETPTAGALAFGSFVGAMTIGRFSIDRLSARYGPVVIVRFGAAVAVVGFGTVVMSTALPLTLAGWALAGLGVAGGVPQVFSAAGNLGDGSARHLSLVVGVGYLAILAGPGVLGWVAEATNLAIALILPMVAAVVCALAAPAVRR
ncbi:MAG: MFS transporter [Mycobacterium kyogaense]|uniref:MFS transporter n=1 Tax=Mycobacterium kyogaense TaxID=2212479 RepID=UPI002FF737CE